MGTKNKPAVVKSSQAEVVYSDFRSYQQAMVQYDKDYRQYLKDYDEWWTKYGDAYYSSDARIFSKR